MNLLFSVWSKSEDALQVLAADLSFTITTQCTRVLYESQVSVHTQHRVSEPLASSRHHLGLLPEILEAEVSYDRKAYDLRAKAREWRDQY